MKLGLLLCMHLAILVQYAKTDTVEMDIKRETLIFTDNEKDGFRDEEIFQRFAPGMVSQQCLGCICKQESNCRDVGCRMDVGSLSCGYFQIKQDYWIDCYKPGKDWKSCSSDIQCASQCVQNYMKRYARHYRCPLNCEGFAREHNGGPNGCHKKGTLAYWNALTRIPGCEHVTGN